MISHSITLNLAQLSMCIINSRIVMGRGTNDFWTGNYKGTTMEMSPYVP